MLTRRMEAITPAAWSISSGGTTGSMGNTKRPSPAATLYSRAMANDTCRHTQQASKPNVGKSVLRSVRRSELTVRAARLHTGYTVSRCGSRCASVCGNTDRACAAPDALRCATTVRLAWRRCKKGSGLSIEAQRNPSYKLRMHPADQAPASMVRFATPGQVGHSLPTLHPLLTCSAGSSLAVKASGRSMR